MRSQESGHQDARPPHAGSAQAASHDRASQARRAAFSSAAGYCTKQSSAQAVSPAGHALAHVSHAPHFGLGGAGRDLGAAARGAALVAGGHAARGDARARWSRVVGPGLPAHRRRAGTRRYAHVVLAAAVPMRTAAHEHEPRIHRRGVAAPFAAAAMIARPPVCSMGELARKLQ